MIYHKHHKPFTITLFISLALHFVILTVLFSLPDIDNHDEYKQVNVRLGIKHNHAKGKESSIENAGLHSSAVGGSMQPEISKNVSADTLSVPVIPDTTQIIKPEIVMQDSKESKALPEPLPGTMQPEFRRVIEQASNNAIASVNPTINKEIFEEEEGVVIGNSAGQNADKLATYEQMLPLWLNKFRKYPDEARSASITGTGEVFIKIDRNGKVLLSRIIKSTGNQALDMSLANMLYEADPVLPIPADYYPDKATFSYKIAFEFKN